MSESVHLNILPMAVQVSCLSVSQMLRHTQEHTWKSSRSLLSSLLTTGKLDGDAANLGGRFFRSAGIAVL